MRTRVCKQTHGGAVGDGASVREKHIAERKVCVKSSLAQAPSVIFEYKNDSSLSEGAYGKTPHRREP